jgi:hypothetical protein
MEGGASKSVLALNEDVFVDENIGVKSESLSRVTEGAILASSLAGLVVTVEGRSRRVGLFVRLCVELE